MMMFGFCNCSGFLSFRPPPCLPHLSPSGHCSDSSVCSPTPPGNCSTSTYSTALILVAVLLQKQEYMSWLCVCFRWCSVSRAAATWPSCRLSVWTSTNPKKTDGHLTFSAHPHFLFTCVCVWSSSKQTRVELDKDWGWAGVKELKCHQTDVSLNRYHIITHWAVFLSFECICFCVFLCFHSTTKCQKCWLIRCSWKKQFKSWWPSCSIGSGWNRPSVSLTRPVLIFFINWSQHPSCEKGNCVVWMEIISAFIWLIINTFIRIISWTCRVQTELHPSVGALKEVTALWTDDLF